MRCFVKKNIKSIISIYSVIYACICFSVCGTINKAQVMVESEINISEEYNLQLESGEEDNNTDNSAESISIPSKEEVIAILAVVLEGMNEEESERLIENIKIANSTMESAYLNDNLFDKLSDSDSLYWQYFDKTGDIQLGWWYSAHPYSARDGITINRFCFL